MTTLDVAVDEKTSQTLKEMALARGLNIDEMASRLLKHAIRAARPKPVYDVEALRAYAKEFEAEDLALADSGSAHRLELLEAEDGA